MSCFLRRHAASWSITCPLCVSKKCCRFANWHRCPECQDIGANKINPILDGMQKEMQLVVGKIRARHRDTGGKSVEVAMSNHYIVVTDIRSLKLAIGPGRYRNIGQHELLHIYLQRCEQALADWSRAFGSPKQLRTLVILAEKEDARRKFSQATFGHPEQKLLYGGGSVLEEGWAQNGFALSVPRSRAALKDDFLHWNCRHMIGHLCISTYHTPGMFEKELPRWVFCGSAHWLSRVDPRNKFHAYFCSYEGVDVSGKGYQPAGKAGWNWPFRIKRIAKMGPKSDPVERMFQASTAKQMEYRMHLRAWSWFDIFLRQDRETFVSFIKGLREAKEARVACKEAFGQAPEHVDQRWREFVLDDRDSVRATRKERRNKADVGAASSSELRNIRAEKDLQMLANRIRGLDRCQNIRSARLLVRLIDERDSDRVREVISLVLNRTRDDKILAYLRGEGWQKAGKLGRAALARTFGEVRYKEATELLRAALQDPFWLARANAIRALALIKDKASLPAIARLAAEDPTAKVRVAAMEALGSLGIEAKESYAQVGRNLKHRAWQVKSAACEALAKIGNEEAVDLLIERLDLEGGRTHEDIRQAIVGLTGMDRDWSGDLWSKWWAKAKNWRAAERKGNAEAGERPPRREDGTRYAKREKETTYYGIKIFSKSVGYVLDTSLSMEQGCQVSKAVQNKMGRTYTAKTRMGVCKQELVQSIRDLDPRTRFSLVFFNHKVRSWKDALVRASPSAKNNCIAAVESIAPAGQTNYYDALRVTLGMAGRQGGWDAAFADTPDTLLFLTDGTPTDGEITKSDELLSWWRERNRFARLRVHVIAMGVTNVDVEFLRKLAESSGGTLVHIKGRY
ncbi:MAG: HEAT repeat domain-containing protein [Planctomycetota bacterium]